MSTALSIPGAHLLPLVRHGDARGDFLKVLHAPTLRALGVDDRHEECFVTRSRRGVVRGLHFQCPPHAHAKLVCCLAGRIRDVLVDLRVGSPAFGRPLLLELSGDAPSLVALPAGVAHGFACASEEAVVLYHTATPHAPEADTGIRWDSVGADWGVADPLLSARDQAFPPLAAFRSPFRFPASQESP